jgi:hypothetical protein
MTENTLGLLRTSVKSASTRRAALTDDCHAAPSEGGPQALDRLVEHNTAVRHVPACIEKLSGTTKRSHGLCRTDGRSLQAGLQVRLAPITYKDWPQLRDRTGGSCRIPSSDSVQCLLGNSLVPQEQCTDSPVARSCTIPVVICAEELRTLNLVTNRECSGAWCALSFQIRLNTHSPTREGC